MDHHKLSRRRFLQFSGTAVAGLVLAACTTAPVSTTAPGTQATTTPASSTTGGALRIASSVHPRQRPDPNNQPINVRLEAEGPYWWLANQTLEPNLVEEAEWEADYSAFTLKVKNGILWSDGEPFTARDIWGSLNLGCHPKVGYYAVLGWTDGIKGAKDLYTGAKTGPMEGVQLIDDYTVRIELVTPTATALQTLVGAFNVVPWHIRSAEWDDEAKMEAFAADPDKFYYDPATHAATGPFVYVEGEPEQFARYAKNRNYHGGEPMLDTVEFITYGSPDATQIAFQRGEVDVAPISDYAYVEGFRSAGATIFEMPSLYRRILLYNWRQPYMNDIRVFRAIDMAIDRKTLSEVVEKGASIPWRYDTVSDYGLGVPNDVYDPEEAMRLLQEANWDPERTIVISTGYTDDVTNLYMPALQDMLGKVGIKVETKIVEGTAYYDLWYQGAFDLDYNGGFLSYPGSEFTGAGYKPCLFVDAAGNEYDAWGEGRTYKGGNCFMSDDPKWQMWTDMILEGKTAPPGELEERGRALLQSKLELGDNIVLAQYKRVLAYRPTVRGLNNPESFMSFFNAWSNKTMGHLWSVA